MILCKSINISGQVPLLSVPLLPRSAHCLNHDLTSAPMTEEERDEYLAQCWKDVTVEGNADT